VRLVRRMGVWSKLDLVRRDRVRAVAVASVVAILLIQLVFFPLPLGNWIRGLVLGLLNAMLAMGMALIYRANRVVNFAQADLGSVPVALGAAFVLFWGWPWLLGFASTIVLAAVLGAVVEMAIVRRFRHSPRLVLTVATLGITQLMVLLGILVPRWWGRNLTSERIPPPVDWKVTIGDFVLQATDLIALIVAPLAIALVAWFLGGSRLGLAIRASAERTDRALMLGIPVSRLNTLVWSVAAVLASVALFLKAGISGVPLGFAVALPTLLLSLAALVIGRLERLPTIVCTAVALGLLESGVQWNTDSPFLAYPIMAAVMFVVLLVQRPGTTRRDLDTTSSWRGVDEVRPLSAEVLAHPMVSTISWTLLAAAVMAVVLFPVVLPVDYVIKGTALIAFAIIGMSLVVLTGWAGQLSFGQMGIVGVGAAVSATFTHRWNTDLTLSLLVGGAAGALAAFAVGVPALRLRGLYLAVTTFAFAVTVESWLLNDRFFGWFPANERIARLPLFGRIAIDTPTRFYAVSVVVAAAVYLMLRSIRRSRTGRAIIALRDNERGAQSYAITPVRVKLTAFTISGAVAGVGGALLVHLNQSFVVDSYGAGESFSVFVSAVIGGLGSLGGAFLGALYLRGTQWFLTEPEWQVLSTGFGVLLVLLVLPSGIGGLWVKLRDVVVRLVTRQTDMAIEPPTDTKPAAPVERVVEPA
jgi:branched-chain amino acid transport system permease protein